MGRELQAQLEALLQDEVGRRLRGRDYLSLYDFSVAEVQRFVEVTRLLKAMQRARVAHPILRGKTLAMIFQKASTRTRVAFEVGMWQLGGYALFLSAQDIQLRRGETIADTARVLSRFVDGIMIRTFDHQDVVDLAEAATVPVINGLTDWLHPTQALADYVTVLEHKGRLHGLKLTYIGDGNNVAHSLMLGGAKLGVHVTVCTPPGYEPDPTVVSRARQDAQATGAVIEWRSDPLEAASGADVLYTDVWASMGQEHEQAQRAAVFAPYQINSRVLAAAHPEAIVMHCLPAHRGEEITADVIDGPRSVVFDEAENRLHAHKAIMALLLRDETLPGF